MDDRASLTEKHSAANEVLFQLKSLIHTGHRFLQNTYKHENRKHKAAYTLAKAPVIASSDSQLWNKYDNDKNWILTAGKIQNLRVAAQYFNGIEVPANQVFSFWAQLGNPTESRGFVEGREIREGCLVATVAGGLCQLSNALYDTALKAGFEIVERHKHTKVIQGSLAEQDRDATVKWNYVDLRFKSAYPFRIETELTQDMLVVSFRSNHVPDTNAAKPKIVVTSKLNDCFSCGNTSCFKHPNKPTYARQGIVTTYVLDEKWPEYEKYITQLATNNDHFLVPMLNSSKKKYQWPIKNKKLARDAKLLVYERALATRWASKRNGKIPPLLLKYDKKLTSALAKHIPVESTHLVVSQNLLPYLWELGMLGGRTYDVLMTRLPMELLHKQLDEAYEKYPSSKTLNDFRAPRHLVDAESAALTRSSKIITPHRQIAAIFNNKSIILDWDKPATEKQASTNTSKVFFPASALARKGAYEIKQLVKEFGFELMVSGRSIEDENFWQGVSTSQGNGGLNNAGIVIYPAYIENQPRVLLRALSKGITVIATDACGLAEQPNLHIVPYGNYDALRETYVKLRK